MHHTKYTLSLICALSCSFAACGPVAQVSFRQPTNRTANYHHLREKQLASPDQAALDRSNQRVFQHPRLISTTDTAVVFLLESPA
jgi:hypothetical protein